MSHFNAPNIEVELPSVRLNGDSDIIGGTQVSAWQTLMKPPDGFGGIRTAAKQRQAANTRRLEKNFKTTINVEEALRARKTYTEVRELVRKSGAICIVHKTKRSETPDGMQRVKQNGDFFDDEDDDDEDVNVSYRNQANLEMYSSENMKARDENKRHPDVRLEINNFWEMLPKTANGNVNKGIYKWFNRKLYFTLVPRPNEEEFDKTVDEDWKNDAVFSHVMNQVAFKNAIFTLTDLWCETVDPREYRDFLIRCQKIVAAPPAFIGSLDERVERRRSINPVGMLGPKTGTAPLKLRRRSSVIPPSSPTTTGARGARGGQSSPQNSPKDTTGFTLSLDKDEGDTEDHDSMPNLRKGAEQIEDEISGHGITSWFATLGALKEIRATEKDDDDDAVYQMLRDLQDRRFDVFEDDKDPSFKLEADVMTQAQDDMRTRMSERGTLAEDQKKLQSKPSGILNLSSKDSVTRGRMIREIKRSQLAEQQDDHVNRLLSSQSDTVDHYRGIYASVEKLEKGRFDELIRRVHKSDTVFITVLNHQRTNVARQMVAKVEHDEDNFKEFAMVTKDIIGFRKCIESTLADGLTSAIYEEFFATDIPELNDAREVKWGNTHFKRGIEWLKRFHSRINSTLEDFLTNTMDTVTLLKTKETSYLHKLHRAAMDLESAQIAAYGAEELMPVGIKLKKMESLQKAKEEATKNRRDETATMQSRHQAWDTMLQDLMTEGITRTDLETAEFKALMTDVKKREDVYPVCEETLNTYEEAQMVQAMAETVAMGARPPVGGLPEEIESAMQFIVWRTTQFRLWLGKYLVNFSEIRHKIWHQRTVDYTNREKEFATTVHDTHSKALVQRLENLERMQDALLDPKQVSNFTEEQSKVMREMTDQLREAKTDVDTNASNSEFYVDSIQRVCQLAQSRSLTRVQRFTKQVLFEVQEMERVQELELARVAQHEAILTMFTENWSEVERQARVSEATSRERRKKEQARIEREHVLAEQKRKDLEEERLRRLEQDEKDRKALEAGRRQREKAVLSTRRRQLEERETKQKEREKQEADDKKRWRQEYLKEEKTRKKEIEERRHVEHARGANIRKSDASHSPTEKSLAMSPKNRKPPTPKGGKNGGGKLPSLKKGALAAYGGEIDNKTQLALNKDKTIQKKTAPSSRIKAAIGEEIKSFMTLNTTSMAINLESFNDRRQDYFMDNASNAAIYAMECTRLRCPIAPSVSTKLSNEELDFTMVSLDLTKKQCNVLSLLDLLLLNPVQRLTLSGIKGIDKDVTKKICQTLSVHDFIQMIDLSNNPDVGPHGGQALLGLVKTNTKIVKLKVSGSNVPAETLAEIQETIEKNSFQQTIGRAEFHYIETVFKGIDTDGSGDVCITELREYNQNHLSELGVRSNTDVLWTEGSNLYGSEHTSGLISPDANSLNLTNSPNPQTDSGPLLPTSAISKTRSQMHERQTQRVDMVRDTLLKLDKEGTGTFTFIDLMCYIYTTWNREDVVRLVKQYTDDSNTGASLDEMQKFVDQFGSNGTVTLHQLAKGLGEADVESLRGAFNECDVDGDGFLSIDEFMSFVGA